MSLISLNPTLKTLFDAHIESISQEEELTPGAIEHALDEGSMVLLGNPAHKNIRPILVGQPSRVKVNANIGTSPFQNHPECERAKLRVALAAGADTVMDLSIAGDLDAIRRGLLEDCVSGLLLQNPHQIRETQAAVQLPFLVEVNQIALNKLMEIFAYENVCGVTGNTINDNYRDILALKGLCKENGILVETFEAALQWDDFQKNPEGLLPVIVQDYRTGEVLMMAYMNEEAYGQTIRTGRMTYYSRSRRQLWLKGETSGHFQYLKSLAADCDKDTLLARVSQVGAACHTGSRSCFFNEIVKKQGEETANPLQVFEEVFDVIKDRKLHPKEGSYTNYLFDKGIDKILKKLGEEATEIVIAAKNPGANEVKYEISDFLYHMMVLMAEKDISWEEITTELANR